ncbi:MULTISPECIES: IclR family transcriptional regulator [Rahnella]|uniref:IclR family transcriptional regulator n=1 Tax=Rahnella TaxID=34037 RepID=UPI001AD876A6|nr:MULTISPECIES: IclR family transcriptional regulator [Rahnella]MDF1893363.1 IclR family transcriptional regulator [Rahnella contaminans]
MAQDIPADEERSGGIQVISRAASVLNALGKHPQGMSLGAIANDVDLPRSTVQRIVAALAEEGLVRSEGNGGVRLGPTLLKLASTVHTDMIAIATPFLRHLNEITGETVAIGRASGRQIANIHCIVSEKELRIVPRVGLNLPIYSTSSGRALLALKTDEEIRIIVGEVLEPATKNTVGTLGALLDIVADVRRNGYSIETGETVEGVSTIAIAIDTILGRYSVSVLIPTPRLEAKQDVIRTALLECKEALTSEIGK